jgi:hypothetical protein
MAVPAENVQALVAMRITSIWPVCAVQNRARWLSPETEPGYVDLAESRIAAEHAA